MVAHYFKPLSTSTPEFFFKIVSCMEASLVHIVLSIFCIFSTAVDSSINLNIYDNAVFEQPIAKTISLSTLNASIPNTNNAPLSAQILGSIIWPKSPIDKFYINCQFDSNLFAIVKIDDHLICAPNIYDEAIIFEYWNLTWTNSANTKRKSFVRIDIWTSSNSKGNSKWIR